MRIMSFLENKDPCTIRFTGGHEFPLMSESGQVTTRFQHAFELMEQVANNAVSEQRSWNDDQASLQSGFDTAAALVGATRILEQEILNHDDYIPASYQPTRGQSRSLTSLARTLTSAWTLVTGAPVPPADLKGSEWAISSYDANEVLSDDAGGHWWPNRAEVRAEELTVVFEIMGNDAFDAYLAYEDDAHNEAVQLAICISYYAKDILKRVGEVPEGCYTVDYPGDGPELLLMIGSEAHYTNYMIRNTKASVDECVAQARRILHCARAVEEWYHKEAEESESRESIPLVCFRLVANSDYSEAMTEMTRREVGLSETASDYEHDWLAPPQSWYEIPEPSILEPSAKFFFERQFYHHIQEAARSQQEMCPACYTPLQLEPAPHGLEASCERCCRRLDLQCYRCLACQWTICHTCHLSWDRQIDLFPLHLAVEEGDVHVAKMYSALIDDHNGHGETPLHVAASMGRLEMAKWLVAQRADVNACTRDNRKLDPLCLAAVAGHKAVVSLLLECRADVCQALYNSVHDRAIPAAQLLLQDFGVDVNAHDGGGRTALHKVVASGNLEGAIFLCDHGACVVWNDNEGETPVQVAFKLRDKFADDNDHRGHWTDSLMLAAEEYKQLTILLSGRLAEDLDAS
ncbi:unnamed protein product [Durusdinium trenchii]